MRFGLCTDIRNVKEVQEAGFDYIEGKLNQFALWTEEEFCQVVELFKQCSIKMETCSLLLPKSMAVIGDKYSEKELREYLDVAFARMDTLGCKLVVFGSGKSRMVPEGMRWQDAFVELVNVTRLIGEIAAQHGICIAIEPLNRAETNMICSLCEGAALQAMVGLDNVGLLADAYHMRREEEDMTRILRCSPLMHTHIATKEGRLYPLEATEEVKEFFSVLADVGYDGTMSIEGKSDDWKVDSIKALEVMRACAKN
ncbi:MAG: sugar phosphate isomerase/epimerase [Sphaerochaetaceae bacterium]|nr:sugar phosphate isomerase/epimerase [Sphaerochaetaceae bacterium]